MFIKKSLFKLFEAKSEPKDIYLLFLLVLVLLWQPAYLHQELNLFEWGLYLPGIDAVSQGQVPYRDFFHLRGPFELYLPALFMKIFGFRADMLGTYFYLGNILTILMAILIAYELIQQRVLLYSCALIIVTRTFPRVAFTFWGGMRYALGLFAVWCLIRFLKEKRPVWLLASGCLTAISLLTSIEIGVITTTSFMVVMALSCEHRRQAWVFLSGFLLIILPYSIYLLSQHAWGSYLQTQWVVVTQLQSTYVQFDRVPDTIPKFLQAVFFPFDKSFYQMTPMYCYMFFMIFYLRRIFNKKITALDQAALVVAVYGLISFLTVFRKIQFAGYEMSLQPEKILLFYLLGHFIAWAQQRFKNINWVGILLIAAVFISSAAYTIGRIKSRYYKSSWFYYFSHKDKVDSSLINGASVTAVNLPRIQHMIIPVWQAQDLKKLEFFVDKYVPMHEAIWVYPNQAGLHFILDRPWVGRFPMVELTWMNDEWFSEYVKALKANHPQYALISKTRLTDDNGNDLLGPANRIKHEWMMRFLEDHYYLMDGETTSYSIYRHVQ